MNKEIENYINSKVLPLYENNDRVIHYHILIML